jgi:hypothetical protein
MHTNMHPITSSKVTSHYITIILTFHMTLTLVSTNNCQFVTIIIYTHHVINFCNDIKENGWPMRPIPWEWSDAKYIIIMHMRSGTQITTAICQQNSLSLICVRHINKWQLEHIKPWHVNHDRLDYSKWIIVVMFDQKQYF